MPERRPNRTLGGVHDEFWQFCGQHELRLQRCQSCAAFAWPPVERCEHCQTADLEWLRVTGTGKLVSWSTFEHKYYEELPVPWETVLVELAEGPLFLSNPLDFSRDEMVPDLPLRVAFLDCEDGHGAFSLPVFRKDEDPEGAVP